MKKFLLLIPALLLAVLTNAAVINITPTSPHSSGDNLRRALSDANDGDEIIMAAGTYVESPGNYIAFAGKSVVVRAADGAAVILKPHVPITLSGGARAEIRGVKIDASELCSVNSYSHLMYPSDGADNNRLILDGCEIYGFNLNNSAIYCSSSTKLDAVTFNNCYFRNITKSCLFLENTNAVAVQITNSTFANIATVADSYWAGVIDMRSTTGSLRVDHCTFYNVQAMSTSYAAIGQVKTSDAIVSNCIFAMPTSTSGVRTIRDHVTANNCLVYNYSSDSNLGMQSDVTKNNCFVTDPLFTDAANGDYSFAGNWVIPSISPARGAATDGSDLGDPRWYSAETLPSSNFASGYQFVGAKAQISGNLWYDGTNEYLYYNDKEVCGTAKWKITATRACIVEATLNMNAATTTGHQFKVEILDANGNSVGETAEPSSKSDAGNIALPDQITLPAAGNYTVKLYNLTAWSSAKIDGVTLSYVGGDVQSMPGTTDIDDAWFSSNGTRTAGEYISIPSGHQHEGWVKWNVSFASAANYNVTVNIDNANGHNYTVALYRSESDESPITLGEGGQKSTIGTIELGSMEVPAGNYIMKVTNATQYSDAKLISVNFAYAGGAAVNLSKDTPASLLANSDAILSDDWTIEGGKITHTESKALTGWAKWNVNSADYGNYNVTVNISSDNGHLVRVEIFDDEAKAPIYTLDETSATQYHTGDQTIDLGNIILDEHEYVVKVSNTGEYSHVQIASIVITYQNGARATLPASCTFTDLMLSPKAHVTEGNLWFNTIGDSDPVGQWAKWNVKVATNGTFLFTMNVTSSNSQTYKISVFDSEENIIDSYEKNPGSSGDKTITHYLYLAAGDYTVKLENTYSWSQGHIGSLVVTQPASLLVLDEAAANNSVLTANKEKAAQPIQLIRTIVKDMYNTICLPFDVAEAQLKEVFGSDVVLKQLLSSSLDASGEILDLNFESATSIYRGTPYIIKTSRNIVNPVFENAVIKASEGAATITTNADFVGNLVAGTIPASEDNLFLGADNTLYFPLNDIEILGMRAYFQIKSGVRALVKGARIVEHESTATGIENVGQQPTANSQKLIENGQIVIIRDGIRYNIMGVRMN